MPFVSESRLRLVPYGPPATDALAEVIEEAKAGDPLAPVTVAPSSTTAGLSLRRTLGGTQGLVNIRFMPLARVAELLGAPRLSAEGRAPLTDPVRRAAIRRALADDPGLFASVADSAATEDALDVAFGELRALTDDELVAYEHRGVRQGEVGRLFRAFRDRTHTRYDDLDLALAAAEAVDGGSPTLSDIGAVVLHLPSALEPGHHALVAALARAGHVSALLGLTGDDRADEPVRSLAASLEAVLGRPDVTAPDTSPRPRQIVLAPDPEEEVRWAVRELLAEPPDPPLRVAIVSADSEPYGRIAADILTEAGIPFHGPNGTTLAQSVPGRLLLGALALPDERFARHDVMAWLSSGPVIGLDGKRAPVERWDHLSREAGITAGLERWTDGLARHAERLARPRPDDAHGDAEERERRGAEALGLAEFVADLADRVDPPTGGWSERSRWASGLLHAITGGPNRLAEWPDHEIDAFRAVESVIEGLADLDPIEPDPPPRVFRRALEQALDGPAPRTTRFGDGVFVGRVGDVVGAAFDRVHVVGIVEGSFPRSAAPASLVTESDRRALDALDTADRRRRDQHRDFLAAMAAAGSRTLGMPRSDPRSGRPRHASPWLLDAASDLHGSRLFGETLTRIEDQGEWLIRLPSAEATLLGGPVPLSLTERDARELAALRREGTRLPGDALATAAPRLARGLDAVAGRASDRATEWDGIVGPGVAALADRAHSPTSLENWPACPFRYFLGQVLRIRPLDTPEEIETLSGLDRGSLVHDVLEAFVRERGLGKPPDEPWDDADHNRLDEIAEETFAEYEARGRTGRELLWSLQQRDVRRTLHTILTVDDELRAEYGASPEAVELAFGLGDDDPVELEIGSGRRLRFRGRIDRVDRIDGPEGSTLRVVDYKTGRALASKTKDPYQDDHFVAGTQLQLPIYALAARRAFGDLPTRAEYWYVNERSSFKTEGYEIDDAVLEEYAELLTRIADGIENGMFPARPGGDTYDIFARRETYEHCYHCDFDRVCTVDRSEAWDRKRHDPALADYVALCGEDVDEGGEPS